MQFIKSYYWLIAIIAMIFAVIGFTIWIQSIHGHF